MDTEFEGALAGDYGAIQRTDDARAFLAKVDWHLSDHHYATFKYNYTWSEQVNGTFDVDSWARSANALERDCPMPSTAAWSRCCRPRRPTRFRFQLSREDRPRPYRGPINPGTGRPFPDTAMDFDHGYRFGMPFFIPVEYHDTRLQLLNNVTLARGDHLFKAASSGTASNRRRPSSASPTARYIFGSVEGFLNFVEQGNGYVGVLRRQRGRPTGPARGHRDHGAGPDLPPAVRRRRPDRGAGRHSTDPPAGAGPVFARQLEARRPAHRRLRPALGGADPARPDHRAEDVFFADFMGREATNETGTYEFPSNGRIPSDRDMFQPRLGWPGTSGRQPDPGARQRRPLPRPHPGPQPGQLALDQRLPRAIDLPLQRPDAGPGSAPGLRPSCCPRPRAIPSVPTSSSSTGTSRTRAPSAPTWASSTSCMPRGLVGSIGYTHARTDDLTRFVNHNDAVFGSPLGRGLGADGGNGLGDLTGRGEHARSRYHGLGLGFGDGGGGGVQFQINYTLSWDRSDDDNERDPFTFRYVDPTRLDREWGYSDRDQRHRLNAWALVRLPGGLFLNHRLSWYSAQPVSEACGDDDRGSGLPAVNPWSALSDRNLRRRPHPPAQHPAQGPRVLLLGPAPVAVRPGGRRPLKQSWRSSTCSTPTTTASPPAPACSSTSTAPCSRAWAIHARSSSACAAPGDHGTARQPLRAPGDGRSGLRPERRPPPRGPAVWVAAGVGCSSSSPCSC